MKKHIVIVGGGVIGLHCAFYLKNEGHEVTVLDASSASDTKGCSYGNCGLLVPSHFIPMASPSMLASGLKMMFDPTSPVQFSLFRNLKNLPWFLRFMKASTAKKVKQAMPVLYGMNMASRKLYAELSTLYQAQSELEQHGLLMLATTEAGFREELEGAEMAKALGIETRVLDRDTIRDYVPDLSFNIVGGIWYSSDGQVNPNRHMSWLKQWLTEQGTIMVPQAKVETIQWENGRIVSVKTASTTYMADEFVLAAGALTHKLAKQIHLNLPLLAGKGSSIDLPKTDFPVQLPFILSEAKIAVTPFADTVRVGSGMEFDGKIGQLSYKRIQAMLNRSHEALPDFPRYDAHKVPIWEGLRPLSPDGMPYIGRTRSYSNLLFATGHAMMGMSLGPVTGKIISNIISDRLVEFDLDLLSPDRYA
jgi:D-amino-acid dehydrogenase